MSSTLSSFGAAHTPIQRNGVNSRDVNRWRGTSMTSFVTSVFTALAPRALEKEMGGRAQVGLGGDPGAPPSSAPLFLLVPPTPPTPPTPPLLSCALYRLYLRGGSFSHGTEKLKLAKDPRCERPPSPLPTIRKRLATSLLACLSKTLSNFLIVHCISNNKLIKQTSLFKPHQPKVFEVKFS